MTIPPDIDQLIHDVLSEFGGALDAVAVARRVRRLDYGRGPVQRQSRRL